MILYFNHDQICSILLVVGLFVFKMVLMHLPKDPLFKILFLAIIICDISMISYGT